MKLAPIPSNESERLQALYHFNILDTKPEERFDRLTRLTRQMFNVPVALVSLIDRDRQWFKSCQGVVVQELARDISFCGHAILGEDIFEIEDASQHVDFSDNPLVVGEPYIRFYAGAPLITREGYALGTLCIVDDQPRKLSDIERQSLRDLADSVLSEIELFEVYKQNANFQAAQNIAQMIARVQSNFILETDRRKAFDGLLADILNLTSSEYGFIGEVRYSEENQPYLKTYAITNIAWNKDTHDFYDQHAPNGMEFRNLKTLFGVALTTGEPVIANDPYNDPRSGGLPSGHPPLKAFLGIPVYSGEELVAMIGMSNREGGYDQDLIDYLSPLTLTVGQLVKSSRSKEQQTELQKSLLQFKNTVDQALDCIFMFDAQTLRFIYVNQGALNQVGYTKHELFNMHAYDIKPEFTEAQFRKMTENLKLSEQKSITFQTVHQHKQGDKIDVEVVLQYVDSDGQPPHFLAFVRDIRKQLAAEKAIEDVKERLRRGQQYANLGTWEWDIVTGELFWTEQIAPLFGYSKGDLETTYENFLGAIHPDDRQAVMDAVNACVEEGKPYDIEHRVVWPDGTVRWLHEKGDVQRDASGRALTMIGVVQDVNERKLVQLALAEREQQLLEAQRLASIGSWVANLRTGELIWSDEVYRIFGHEPGSFEPSVQAFHAAVHPDDFELVRKSEEVAAKQGRHDVVHRILRPDGAVRYVHELAEMSFDEFGNPHSLTGTVQDVTELKESENSLKIFQRVFNATEQGIGVTDAQGYLIYTNPAHDRLHGYQHGECLGLHFSTFLKEQTMQEQGAEIMASIQEGKNWSGLLPIVCKDGSELITASSVGFISGDDGKPLYLFNILTDYSTELARQSQLEMAKETAERANRAKSEFLSSMSHELRTPLNSIIGFSQLLELSDLSEKQIEQLRIIGNSGKHLLSLINDVLEFAKIESGKLALNIESVEVHPILERVVALTHSEAVRNYIEVQITLSSSPVFIRADVVRLKQVLLNLMSNAIKYNRPHGKVMLSCGVVKFGESRFWELKVQDTGIGVAQKDLHRLFEPFDRLGHETSNIEGTGIGLSITKDLVDKMGGMIEVESELNVGTTFTLRFELSETAQTQVSQNLQLATRRSHDQALQVKLSANKLKVLYVEDNPANMKLMAQIGQSVDGIEMRIAPSAENGLEQARQWLPHLVLMDINLPGMNGDEAITYFKGLEGYKETPPAVYAVTANALEEQLIHYHKLGFDAVIAKPFDLHEIIQKIEALRDSIL